MSGGLCPSKSTVYLANLPYSLTNNDLHKILEKYGKVVKVTMVKDKVTRKSSGVAFVLFLEKGGALNCVKALNNQVVFGRTLKCSIAKDNGRTTEFIRRKEYKDKTQCYECGEYGHLSYNCPKNVLGDREPVKKKKKRKFNKNDECDEEEEQSEEEEEVGEDPALESLSAAIRYQQEKVEEEEYRIKVATGEYGENSSFPKKKKFKKSDYFSDEEEVEENV